MQDVSLSVEEGEILAVLGPNGAGKSTLMLCLLGLLPLAAGEVRIDGQPLAALARAEIAARVAYVPQSAETAFAFDVAQMVLMGRSPNVGAIGSPSLDDRGIAEEAMERVGVWSMRERAFTELSGGERQLVLIARALAQDAPIVVMDEPTASLDLSNQGRVLALVRDFARMGKSVVMTTHAPDQAFNLACRAALMKAGRIVASGLAEEICTLNAMNDLYGAPLQELKGGEGRNITAFAPWLD